LAEGVHTFEVDGCVLSYHVHGTGPVCVAHPGGPGIFWGYLRAPELEQRLTMVYLEPAGTGGSDRLAGHPHGYTRARYSRHLAALIDHLQVPRVHLLGHSHGGFVAQYHALHRPEQLAGVVLYDSAPVNGPGLGAEAMRAIGEFAARHAGKPGLESALGAFQEIPGISDDESHVRVARAVLPVYLADYWADDRRWALMQSALETTYISGLGEHGEPDVVDDRAALSALKVPTLVVVGRFDVMCGMRWGEELHRLIPGSQLLVLEHSGHFGHLEEPGQFAREVAAFVTATATAATADA
jgi:pimeloyl-ACP methyl ester carboxylesterase